MIDQATIKAIRERLEDPYYVAYGASVRADMAVLLQALAERDARIKTLESRIGDMELQIEDYEGIDQPPDQEIQPNGAGDQ